MILSRAHRTSKALRPTQPGKIFAAGSIVRKPIMELQHRARICGTGVKCIALYMNLEAPLEGYNARLPFNITNDPGETVNLIDRLPDIAADLQSRVDAARKVFATSRCNAPTRSRATHRRCCRTGLGEAPSLFDVGADLGRDGVGNGPIVRSAGHASDETSVSNDETPSPVEPSVLCPPPVPPREGAGSRLALRDRRLFSA